MSQNPSRLPAGVMMEHPDPYQLIDLGLLDRDADKHLRNWAEWHLGYRGKTRGYDHNSSVVRSPSSSSVDDMLDRMDTENARICDAVIDSLTGRQQSSIHNVYVADVWKFRGSDDPVGMFIEAAAAFWAMAQRRGLF